VNVSAIIIHYGRADYTEGLVASLIEQSNGLIIEIIVVDNASPSPPPVFPDDTQPPVRIQRLETNRGYGAACNAGVATATGSMYFILNNDVIVQRDAIDCLVQTLDRTPGNGAVGPRLVFPDGRFQLSWGKDASLRAEAGERSRQKRSREGHGLEDVAAECSFEQSVDWITGAAILLSRDAWHAVGGFDESYFFYFEDLDICRRLRLAGYDVVYQPAAVLVHFGGGSQPLSNPDILSSYRRGQLLYYARYNSALQFYTLKCYLLVKFSLLCLGARLDRATVHTLLGDIFRFPRAHGAIQRTRIQT
jgi:GT2 family glycosyltransferase